MHPNGVCLIGHWRITEADRLLGLFQQRQRGARDRPVFHVLRRNAPWAYALALDGRQAVPDDRPQPRRAASHGQFHHAGGHRRRDTEFINDAELRNAPDTTITRRGAGVAALLKIGLMFSRVDKEPSIRQLYPIAELGKPAATPTRAPEFMRLLVAPGQPRIAGADLDFRDEIMAQIFDRGDPVPKRTLTFNIEVTDQGRRRVPRFRERRTFQDWRQIGSLDVRQRRHLLQRRLRHSLQPSDLARRS